MSQKYNFRQNITDMNTEKEFHEVAERCRALFNNKLKDYGPSWRILRLPSLTDQIYIKANRIRSIQTKASRLVDEGIEPEFVGILNYAAIAIVQLRLGVTDKVDIDNKKADELYAKVVDEAFDLMTRKNHDYDEAWRQMRISSMTDLILVKLLRIKQIEDNNGVTLVSEGLEANYYDIINYAAFCLILIGEGKTNE